MKVKLTYLATIMLLASLCLAPSLLADQTSAPVPPESPADEPENVSEWFVPELEETARLAADDYLAAISDLEDLLNRYSEFFADLDDATLRAYQLTFDQFATGIERGNYSKNPEYLIEDIRKLTAHLRVQERDLEESGDHSDHQLRRQIHSLRRELAAINDLIEHDIVEELELFESEHAALQEYIRAEIEEADIRIGRYQQEAAILENMKIHQRLSEQRTQDEVTRRILIDGLDLARLEELDSLVSAQILLALEDIPQLGELISKHTVEALDSYTFSVNDKGEVYILSPDSSQSIMFVTPDGHLKKLAPAYSSTVTTGKAGASSGSGAMWADTLVTSGKRIPIYVTHGVGDVEITGWDSDVIVAELTVVVSAATKTLETKFTRETLLELSSVRNGYYIETSFPELSDPRTTIQTSKLQVFVPAHNRLLCDNSFGKVMVTDISSKVSVKGNYSTVVLGDIHGAVDVENTSGKVTVADVNGPITVLNSFAPVNVSDCSGLIRIENNGGHISISSSQGDAELVNTGVISVVEHDGRVEIENSNGAVTVSDLTGSLLAFNSYQPLIVEHITGSANLENTNALISAVGVSGRLKIRNKYGNIMTENLGGPIDLESHDGQIMLVLDNELLGRSRISSHSGLIDVSLHRDMDLRLSLKSDNGNISSEFPLKESGSGRERSSEIVLGDGQQTLSLIARRSSISITEIQ